MKTIGLVYDNMRTMQRECWSEGKLLWSLSARQIVAQGKFRWGAFPDYPYPEKTLHEDDQKR